ncbi:universal bacterial protein YeaZ [gut metagenome]|uniref:Universal bacterial protein YeaZ n=1 Tax=gut metagenome TaxID=749906 RepID=J9G7W5_9ZZZZ
MSCLLHIETSTDVCSVALSQDGECIAENEDRNGPSHASVLPTFVEEMISFADNHAIPLDGVSVSAGPGSYTGLRIGVSTAKGICYGRNLKLIAVPTLQVLCVPTLLYNEELPEDALLCPMIDARRMEVYAAVYNRGLGEERPIQADIVTAETYQAFLDEHPVYFLGNGAAKCKEVIKHPNAHFIDNVVPLARNMMPLAERAMALQRFEDVAYYEPYYLKDFVAGISQNPVLKNL